MSTHNYGGWFVPFGIFGVRLVAWRYGAAKRRKNATQTGKITKKSHAKKKTQQHKKPNKRNNTRRKDEIL